MADLTKTVDGKALPKEKFAMVLDPADTSKWHLPIDEDHIDAALKMFGHEEHGTPAQRAAAARKIAAAARAKGIDKDRISAFEDKYAKSAEHAEPHDYSGGWIEIFKAGDYTSQGKAKVTRDDLARVVNDYDPEYHEAPVCIGHPDADLPAYAWIDRLKLDGNVLLAKERQVDPAFAEMRKAGRFKKRSAAFYRDANGNIAGLRHVGWLGAQPPAVKGLRDAAFDDRGMSYLEIEFEEENAVAEKTVKEQIAEFFAEMFSGKKSGETATFSEADVKRIATEAVAAATKPLNDKIAELHTSLTDQTAKFAEGQTAAATKQRASEAISTLKARGRWVPAFDRQGIPLLFEEAAKSSATLEFGEGDQRKKLTPLQMLVQFAEGFAAIVPNGRVHAPSAAAQGSGKGTGDPLTDMAYARAKEKSIAFAEALTQIAEENPELTSPGGAQAGQV